MVEKHEQGEKLYIKIEMNIYYYCMSIRVYDVCMHMGQRLWRSEDNMFKSVLFFHFLVQDMCSGCQACTARAFTY